MYAWIVPCTPLPVEMYRKKYTGIVNTFRTFSAPSRDYQQGLPAGITRANKSKVNTLTFSLFVHECEKVHAPHVFNKNIKLNFRTLQEKETLYRCL